MYTSAETPPSIVVVGNYGVGKSSFVRALVGDVKDTKHTYPNPTGGDNDSGASNNTASRPPPVGTHFSNSSQESEFEISQSELVMEARVITITDAKGHDHTVRVVDTAARDVTGTQQQMQNAVGLFRCISVVVCHFVYVIVP